MPVILQKFGPQWEIADPSPFCVKLESFMRLNNIPYDTKEFNPKSTYQKSPKKKVPYVTFENGEVMGDSTLIIERLCHEQNIEMERGLTPEQKATSDAFRTMLDEGFYWPAVYSRWQDERGWSVIKPIFFPGSPAFLMNLLAGHIRRSMIKNIYAQGTGRHSEEEIYAIGTKMLKSLSDLLGHNQWFFGQNQPGLLDIWSHAFVINIIRPPVETQLKANTLEMKNLCRHAENFQKLVYNGGNALSATDTRQEEAA